MKTKSLFSIVAVAALVGAAIASCPNACSGHGSCGNHDRCKCYANFIGGDCSERRCPYGRSGKECSGRGTCDRGAGSCECADGYSGASCQRVLCPNECSGKGSCDTTTGLCNCAGGYSGNDCGTRLCPKGDDPLTHEVENAGDGSASQQAEVQTVTFNAGRGLGGSATLTYHDLYGQSWTTRPFNVGGDNIYRLEIAIVPDHSCASSKCEITFTYDGKSSTSVVVRADGSTYTAASATITAETIRVGLLKVFGGHRDEPYVGKDRGNTLYVRKHHSSTSAKIGGSIYPASRLTFDIVIPVDMSGHDDNGELKSELAVAWTSAPAATTTHVLNLYKLGDRSAEIEAALTSLPNQVIPSVTVSKVDVTDTGTNSDGANGNIYAQSYAVTFNNEANSGDQHMLECNAAPCDEDGCANRGPGVSEVRYMHHDPENKGEGINFVNQGYFIMDVGSNTVGSVGVSAALSAGSIKIMWDTGAGVSSAVFAIVATAAEVQTALRTIDGWEAVTVELYGSKKANNAQASAKILENHQFKVTFAAGYDDMGKSPTFVTLTSADGAYAAPNPSSARARLYDQRFSNSLWLGKVTGYVECKVASSGEKCLALHTAIDGTQTSLDIEAQFGDVWVTTNAMFGVGGTGNANGPDPDAAGETNLHKNLNKTVSMTNFIQVGTGASLGVGSTDNKVSFAYLYEGATSVQTSDYVAVGSTIEVLPTTWDDGDLLDDDIDVLSNNKYRKFKVTGHVTNPFNREFAKLDSFPVDDGVLPSTANGNKPDYTLKITSNNGTVHTYSNLAVQITLSEVQRIVLGAGNAASTQTFKLYYKGEESQDIDQASSAAQVAEEINGFSALSGPVTVTSHTAYVFDVEFDEKDGDVAEMTTNNANVNVATRKNGWSIEGPVGLGLDTMQAGGTINVTAKETCTFTVTKSGTPDLFFCYDGTCSSTLASNPATAAAWEDAVESIVDNNGDQIFATGTVSSTNGGAITLPLGYSCDGLELRTHSSGADSIVKAINRHNNGKQFKITRSFLQSTVPAASEEVTTAKYDCDAAKQVAGVSGCHAIVPYFDSLVVSHAANQICDADNDGFDPSTYPISRTITDVTKTDDATYAYDSAHRLVVSDFTAPTASKCAYRVARHVITLDAPPTASTHANLKTLLYTSPVGNCGVRESTKGTYESYECSNRGACDSKSGLCACYDGYSGQSCQTQTVLV